jgi:hypothetical protein
MISRRRGLSRREYGRHAGISAAYVSKMVADRKIPILPDGSIDARAADASRAQRTRVGKGQRRLGLQATTESPTACCAGCGATYNIAGARSWDSPDAKRFCCAQCCRDVAAGLSIAQIRRKIARELRGA